MSASVVGATLEAVVPSFKQYRDNDGKFYFKLLLGEKLLLQSEGFVSPKDAGALISRLKKGDKPAIQEANVLLDGKRFGSMPAEVEARELEKRLALLSAQD